MIRLHYDKRVNVCDEVSFVVASEEDLRVQIETTEVIVKRAAEKEFGLWLSLKTYEVRRFPAGNDDPRSLVTVLFVGDAHTSGGYDVETPRPKFAPIAKKEEIPIRFPADGAK